MSTDVMAFLAGFMSGVFVMSVIGVKVLRDIRRELEKGPHA